MPSYSRILGWICFFALLFLSGCGSISEQSEELNACIPPTGDPNPYRALDTSDAYLIYQASQFPKQGMDGLPDPTSQRSAFNMLEAQVRQWSVYEDVLVKDNVMMRVTVTFISPDLIEAVVLNQIIYSGIPPVPDFPSAIKMAKDDIANREELLFLVTVTSSQYRDRLLPDDRLVLDIPITYLTLTNTSYLSITPAHSDKNLDDEIDLRDGPVHGYLGYPLAVQKNGICTLVMDTRWDTTLTLHVPNVMVNGAPYDALTWVMNVHPMVDMNAPNIDPDELAKMLANPSIPVENYYNPIDAPPVPENGKSKDDQAYWDQYWDDMSRFIWHTLIN
jgi:hypothetical protein